ncbi:dephospho-CoA kinase [bacterium]|nr:dephospho-CoA kinase [bacterium]
MIIGVTGNIGSGKSSFAKRLHQNASLNSSILLDADQIARHVSTNNSVYRNWLSNRFGDSIFDGEELDRKKLGTIVFSNPAIRLEIENAIRPHIRKQLYLECEKARPQTKTIIIEAALIFEWYHSEFYHSIITVVADIDQSINRAAIRLNVPTETITKRYGSQLSQFRKAMNSDIIVFNDGTLKELYTQADYCWEKWFSKL